MTLPARTGAPRPARADASPARRRSPRPPGPPSRTSSSGRTSAGRPTTIRTKRAAAVAERADWEALRLAGAAIKDEVLRDLPALLEQLERAVTAAGGAVHWARDAAEANAIVAGIARDHGAREVVKVKSMATQEIELNEALRQEGIDVWETDLAEMIVQLGHDLPSHILVPAIHRNRTEIRDIFIDEMGRVGRPAPAGLSDDPAELAEAARLHLREKFLRARVAVSGANFAVAETGTVMVVESEGNGRMCLTLPEVLITVMGIEKLVPTWQDLEVFLQLLPRSSTAERMNPYTSMWTGVTPGRRPERVPPDPARQRPDGRAVRHGPAGRRSAASAARPASTSARSTSGRAARRTARSTRARSGRSSRRSCAASPRVRSTSRPRRCRSRRRCAAPASTSARSGSTSPRSSSTCAARSSGSRRRRTACRPGRRPGWRPPPGRSARPRRLGAGRARWPASAGGCSAGGDGCGASPDRARSHGWFRARDLKAPARESFRAWWRRTDGGRGGDR